MARGQDKKGQKSLLGALPMPFRVGSHNGAKGWKAKNVTLNGQNGVWIEEKVFAKYVRQTRKDGEKTARKTRLIKKGIYVPGKYGLEMQLKLSLNG